MGVGGIDSWSPNAYPMTPYRIASDEQHSIRYRLSPIDGPNFEAKTLETF